MLRSILFAVLFIVIGLVGFALVAPLIFSGDTRKIGAMAFPVIVLACGLAGFWFGSRKRKKS
jgi:uncharacterized RDD family membrane protein YckC